jgi:hypothetical protein
MIGTQTRLHAGEKEEPKPLPGRRRNGTHPMESNTFMTEYEKE